MISVIVIILSACLSHITHVLFLFLSEGDAERFVIGPVSSPLVVGVPFNIPLLIKDGYDHPTVPPPDLKPVLQCRLVRPLYSSKIYCSVYTM